MPRHQEFENLFHNLVNHHGAIKGSQIYYGYVQKYKLNEHSSLSTQKPRKFDAIPANFEDVRNRLDKLLQSEKNKYALIIQKYLDEIFNETIDSAAQELSVAPVQLTNFNKMNAARDILKENFTTITFELFDAIDKEITFLITDLSLTGAPISNTKLKQEIASIFAAKEPRLESQAITESTRATNTFLEIGYKESGLVAAKQWVSVIDDRTTGICQGLNGAIVDIGKPFPTGDYQPPAHINCRSRIQAITVSKA
jgi:SPP1 gp7 family putative phage head morphogenesis protein